MLSLALAIICGFLIVALMLSLLVGLGWYRKYLIATENANFNAGIWAEAERDRWVLEIANTKLLTQLESSNAGFTRMTRIAGDAIKLAQLAAQEKGEEKIYQDAKGEFRFLEDSVLDADAIE